MSAGNDTPMSDSTNEDTETTDGEYKLEEAGITPVGNIATLSKPYEPGVARIKTEYLNLNYKPKIVTEYLPQDVKEELLLVEESRKKANQDKETPSHDPDGNDTSQPPRKKVKKLKGQHKKRPIQKHTDPSSRLCPAYISETTCTFGEKCKFSHNVEGYVNSKPPDIGPHCYVYEKFGKCTYGVTCRYGGQHISDDCKNLVNQELYTRTCKEVQTKNSLPKEVQTKLRRKKYDFSLAESVHKNAVKTNQNLKTQNNFGASKTSQTEHQVGTVCDSTIKKTDTGKKLENEASSIGTQSDQPECSVDDGSNVADDTNSNVTAAGGNIVNIPQPQPTDVVDDRPIGLRSLERKKISFKDKLYLAPLTTVGNLPFRRICKNYGADITCGEMAMSTNLLQGHQSEWALLKRHASEDLFGVQICGGYPDTMARCTQLLNETVDVDFIDINVGCPIDMVFKKGEGSALMGRLNRFEQIVKNMTTVSDIPVTVKMRTGIYENKQIAHSVISRVKEWGVSLITLHGRTREQRYTKMADWNYINECSQLADPVPFFGNGDVLSYEDYNLHREQSAVSGIMIARGALIKPWLFTEIKEQRHWDISANERMDMLRSFTNFGLEHWGSDDQGVDTTRKFLLEWLSFLYRYIPVGVLERVPQKINERPQPFFGRNDLETLMSSGNSGDWVRISEMLLGPVKPGFTFLPKHKANAYK